jgi:hypothetical protein
VEASAGSEAAARKEWMKGRTPRVDWAGLLKRTFDFDVFACVRCGGRLKGLGVREGRAGSAGYSLDNYKNDNSSTEVHSSSGIANNAFYLLTNGGTNRTSGTEVKDGIGMEKSLKIFYRALDNYMTPNTTFAQAREATINAATDLYGANSAEVQKVKASWGAVGVNCAFRGGAQGRRRGNPRRPAGGSGRFALGQGPVRLTPLRTSRRAPP